MTASEFTIYGTPKGFLAVTNPVRQRILEALGQGDRTLSDLVRITGRAKSTLSAVHLRDLLRNSLVEERAHPRDARVKVYRLVGRRIGSSAIPVEDLRESVRHYVAQSRGTVALPLASLVGAFDSLPAIAPEEARWVGLVGERLGALAAPQLAGTKPAEVLRALAEAWRAEALGTARLGKPDGSGLELAHAEAGRAGGARCAFVRGLLQGVLTTRAGRAAWVRETACAGVRGRRCRFAVTWPAKGARDPEGRKPGGRGDPGL